MFLLHIPKIEDFPFLLPYPLTASHKSEYKIKKKKKGEFPKLTICSNRVFNKSVVTFIPVFHTQEHTVVTNIFWLVLMETVSFV